MTRLMLRLINQKILYKITHEMCGCKDFCTYKYWYHCWMWNAVLALLIPLDNVKLAYWITEIPTFYVIKWVPRRNCCIWFEVQFLSLFWRPCICLYLRSCTRQPVKHHTHTQHAICNTSCRQSRSVTSRRLINTPVAHLVRLQLCPRRMVTFTQH